VIYLKGIAIDLVIFQQVVAA